MGKWVSAGPGQGPLWGKGFCFNEANGENLTRCWRSGEEKEKVQGWKRKGFGGERTAAKNTTIPLTEVDIFVMKPPVQRLSFSIVAR